MPADLFSEAQGAVLGTVLPENGPTSPNLAILRDSPDGPAPCAPCDNVWGQIDFALFDRPVIPLCRIHAPERPVSLFQEMVETAA